MRRAFIAGLIFVASTFSALGQSAAPMGPTAAPLPGTLYDDFGTPGATSFQIPVYAQSVDVWLMGAGGGGGSGRQGASSSIRTGGGGGSIGASWRQRIPVSFFGGPGSTIPVVIGAGGAGGAAQTTSSTNGNAGQPGQMTGLGTIFLYQQPATTSFQAVIFANNLFTAAGASGKIYTSANSTTWVSQTSGTSNQINGIAFSSSLGLYVAVGAGGTIITSPNSVTWTTRTSGVSTALNAVLWDGTYFVAVGNAGVILTSTNGTTWTANAYSSANNLVDVAYDGTSIYNAVDNTGNVVKASSPPTGTWTATQITTSSAFPFTSISFGNSLWVAVGFQSIYTSANGTSWTVGANFAGTNLGAPASVRYANGYWWLLNGINIYWSYAATGWFHTLIGAAGIGTPTGTQATAYGSGIWIIVASGGYLATTTAVAPYSLYAVGGNQGAGGATAGAAGGLQLFYGMFTGGAGGSSIDTGSGGSGFDGSCGGGAAGGSADASNNIYLPGGGGNATLVGRVNGGAGGTATTPPSPGASTTNSQSEWGGSAGGGGAYIVATIGQAGGAAGNPCAGGSGGGASDNTFNSGAGSAGGNGAANLSFSAF